MSTVFNAAAKFFSNNARCAAKGKFYPVAYLRAMWYNRNMNIDLKKYAGKHICVAVSGGRDSMALLHCLHAHAAGYGITLTALNCDHRMRGEASERDSAFVAEYCKKLGVPLSRYVAGRELRDENDARAWRLECYMNEAGRCDCVATAHHLNDNAETVLFNLARGTALAGMRGITDAEMKTNDSQLSIIRPLIACTRADIDAYIAENGIPYVDDETNFTTDYTRNKIRLGVLPALEEAVPGAAKAIYRFSRLAAEDEEYFERQAKPLLSRREPYGNYIAHCEERVIFRRAAVEIIAGRHQKKDYTSGQLERLYNLQFAENGKKFEFLGLTAFKEESRICIIDNKLLHCEDDGAPYEHFYRRLATDYCGQTAAVCFDYELDDYMKDVVQYRCPETAFKVLRFDGDKIPPSATVRFMRAGDRFTKFGGGTKKLGDWFTDKKIPVRLRKTIPLLCDGNDVLLIFGAEISDGIKTDKNTKCVLCAIAEDYTKI